jgi:DNA ligase-associated metallophosphoesterase
MESPVFLADFLAGSGHVPPVDDGAHRPADAVLFGGQDVLLLPGRALWWPAGSTLFVADVHLGKAATFRARGLPVPTGTTQDNLERLSQLLARHMPQRLVVLGDFLHAAEAHTPAVLAALRTWRGRWPGLDIVLVRGNHDSHAGDPPPWLGMRVVDEPFLLGPFACCHHPQLHATHHVLAGHVHPAVLLRGAARDVLRLPCFSAEPGLTVLPAFGAFTGSHTLPPASGRTLYAIGGDRVWPVPPR